MNKRARLWADIIRTFEFQTMHPAQRLSVICCRLPVECAHELAAIELESNRPPWSEALFRSEFSNRYSCLYGARLNGKLIGFLVCHVVLDEAHLVNLGVLKNQRRQGVGASLLKHLLDDLFAEAVMTVCLEVRQSNLAARRLYERLGFEEVALREGYYSDNGESAVLMRLNLRDVMSLCRGEEGEPARPCNFALAVPDPRA